MYSNYRREPLTFEETLNNLDTFQWMPTVHKEMVALYINDMGTYRTSKSLERH